MKKTWLYAFTAAMALSMTACGSKTTETEPVETTMEETVETVEETTEEAVDVDETEEADESVDDAETEDGDTEESAELVSSDEASVAQTLLADFNAMIEENADISAQEIASSLISNEIILFAADTAPVEEGLLTGFGNTEITGFEDGVLFCPIIGSIPFVGYIFDLPEDADADEFAAFLEENANPRWNVCTEAEETVVETNGSKVFFVMSPISLED